MSVYSDEQIKKILIDKEVITEEQAASAQLEMEAGDKDFIDTLSELSYADEKTIFQTYADALGMEYVDLKEFLLDMNLVKSMDALTAQQYMFVPLEKSGPFLKIAMLDPFDLKAIDDLAKLTESNIDAVITNPKDIEKIVMEHYGASAEDIESMIAEIGGDEEVEVMKGDENIDVAALEKEAESAPIIKLVNLILMQSLRDGASDIHVEPFEKELLLRYRVDGVCRVYPSPPKKLQGPVISRLKIMSKMDIAEHRIPQDGRIKIKMLGKEIDFRVSALPSLYGESVVLRLLDKESVSLGLEQVGFIEDNKRTFDEIIRKPNGILLVTGPTGSGKTTTLYSALNEINSADKKIITIEDPVEYQLAGINQVQVKHEIGLDFARGLRAMLRQSPDVVMLGEIRDKETAEIAIRAALTGHLVFSTLHTNDAPSAVSRLIDIGINPFLIASSVQAIMAQRLARTICPACKEEYFPGEKILNELGFPEDERKTTTFYRGAGCDTCNYGGYKGRTGIFELMVVNDEIKELVLKSAPASRIRKAAIKGGMRTLRQDGFQKVKLGMTTVVEVARVA